MRVMTEDLTGRHVVLTGAAGGLGSGVLDALLAAGAECHLPLRGPAREVRAHAHVHVSESVDLADEAAVTSFYAACPPLWASVHLAGGFKAAPLGETSLADLHAQIDLNVTTAFLCCREAARNMRANPGGGGGRIVNVGSRAAVAPTAGSVAYTLAKAAVGSLTQALAAELAPAGILVNAVLPSTIDTAANRAAMPKADHTRWPKPHEVASAILWLASPANTLTSGALVPVYGRA
jgi:NAD(P)-dependent dehydrogenase (short-subunit alcohol dehydrogenase family)